MPTLSTSEPVLSPRFANVSCSQCGQDQGPGDSGFSDCRSHRSDVQNRESDAFESAEDAAFQTARHVIAKIDGITDAAFDARALALIVDKLRKRVESGSWKQTECAADVAEKLSDAVFYLENAADDQVRSSL